ncbi:MAG: hypothetical protein J5764_05430 [Bacteroidales bacterium]|nr:hypothetical protein [Bacteroidales bacterium]
MRNFVCLISALILSISTAYAKAPEWAPAGSNIRTTWAEKVNPANPLPEYPRPQMQRAEWMNLNGLWNYGITEAESADFSVEGSILVPFAVESSLSGVGRGVNEHEALWYERSFSIPSKWRSGNILLHFGAVDWKADVWVNGSKVGEHTGGYAPFSFDITPYLKKSGKQTLRVKVQDATDSSWQPRGKQWMMPVGIWYTPVTGIWQTVWMEPVAANHIENYLAVSDIDAGTISLNISTSEPGEGELHSCLYEDGVKIAEADGENPVFKVEKPRLWSPDSPFLYDIEISLSQNGSATDAVKGYTAMRKISVIKESTPNKFNRLALNNEILFQYGPLDQGWWPDGLYTAPTDEALRYDIERTKAWGFNMIRKHIKVEPARWYWWCDKLGIMVWQDMPSIADHGGKRNGRALNRSQELKDMQTNVWASDSFIGGTDCTVPQEWKDNYYKEWGEIMDCLKCFQSIVVWVPFNEAWGQFDTPEVVRFTRSKDATRLINPSSGGNFSLEELGDILDVHHYPGPAMKAFEGKVVNVLGEYGGIGWPVDGHLWKISDKNWGYGGVKHSGQEVLDQYEDFARILKDYIKTGCSAAVYTQTTDVEVEVNGIMTYDRKVIKVNEASLNAINTSVISSLGAGKKFPAAGFSGKTAIVAHRGFWNCEEAGFSENSIASLRSAQKAGVWGSEFDIHLTADNVVIVNHDAKIAGLAIEDNNFETLAAFTLPNGERRPSLDEYLTQGEKGGTVLVIELKKQKDYTREDLLLSKTLEAVKAHGLWDPSKVVFISFSWHICSEIARIAPEFTCQYLSGNYAPARLESAGINGLDYKYQVLMQHPEWIEDAHARGMSVNVWTVNGENDIKASANAGVDAITTNSPLLARQILGAKEQK